MKIRARACIYKCVLYVYAYARPTITPAEHTWRARARAPSVYRYVHTGGCIWGRKLGHGGNVPEAGIDIQTRRHHPLSPSLFSPSVSSLFRSPCSVLPTGPPTLLLSPRRPASLFIFPFCRLPRRRRRVNGPSGMSSAMRAEATRRLRGPDFAPPHTNATCCGESTPFSFARSQMSSRGNAIRDTKFGGAFHDHGPMRMRKFNESRRSVTINVKAR